MIWQWIWRIAVTAFIAPSIALLIIVLLSNKKKRNQFTHRLKSHEELINERKVIK